MSNQLLDLRELPIGTVVEALEDIEVPHVDAIISKGTHMTISDFDPNNDQNEDVYVDVPDDWWWIAAHQPVRVVS